MWRAMSFWAGICVGIVAVPVFADGPGGYGNNPYAWIHAGGYETDEDVLFDEATFDWTWGASPVIGSAYCLGDIRQAQTATAKARSRINYHDPFGTGTLSIGGDVETWKPFLVGSGSLPAGTQVPVSLGVGYAGTLQALESVEGKYSYCRASGALTLYDDSAAVLAARAGEAEVECELDESVRHFSTETDGVWDGLLTQGVDGNGDRIYSLSYEDLINFTAVVGQRYWLYFDLATSANSSSGSALGWAGSATFAQANFSNTATYQLGSTADVTFTIVPEPATLGLLTTTGLMLTRRRRTG